MATKQQQPTRPPFVSLDFGDDGDAISLTLEGATALHAALGAALGV